MTKGPWTQAAQKSAIRVYVIEQNQLAAEYLLQVLSGNARILAHPLTSFSQLSASGPTHPILVVDNLGFEVPLSECLRSVRRHAPQAKFIILDQALSEDEVSRLLWFGVHGYLDHGEVRDKLIRAIFRVFGGGLWFAPRLLEDFIERDAAVRREEPATRAALTPREKEVLELVKRRLSNKEIADILKIRESTVKFHLSHVFSKLQTTTRRELFKKPEMTSYWANLLLPAR